MGGLTEPLLTDADMAERYGKSRGWVQEKCRKGWPHLRAGKSIRFTAEDVAAIDQLLRPKSTTAPAANPWGKRGRTA